MKEITIGDNVEGIRLNKYIKKILPNIPNSLLYKLLRKKYFELNGKKAEGNELLKSGDKLSIFLGEETYNKFLGETRLDSKESKDDTRKLKLSSSFVKDRIVYEDDNIIIYDKPAGLLSQSANTDDESVNSVLGSYLLQKKKLEEKSCEDEKIKEIFRPSVINRLDRNTKGLIIFAKTYIAARVLSELIKNNELEKHYKALVNGIVEKDSDTLINLYKKDEAKNIAIIKDIDLKNDGTYDEVKLIYKVIEKKEDTTLLDIDLITGKSHQIRAQLSHIGHPVVGDKKYMDIRLYDVNVKKYGTKSQELTCYKIKFPTIDNDILSNLSDKVFSL